VPGFPKSARVLRTAEFRNIYDHGVRLSTPLFAAFLFRRPENQGEGARLGLTVPRAIGGAVVRNRIKRRLRDLFRRHRADFGPCDIVLNPRRTLLDASSEDLLRALRKVMERSKS
jgi:ribonuclease P protein component